MAEDFEPLPRHVCDLPRKADIEKRGIKMSDQEREKHGHRDADKTDDDVNADVEAHKHGHRDADITADDDSNDVEAHKHGGKDS
jgi:hypothetical protein